VSRRRGRQGFGRPALHEQAFDFAVLGGGGLPVGAVAGNGFPHGAGGLGRVEELIESSS
jgi:hypothetical protein